jgi:4-aminobutyrate aminotransferase
MSRSDVEEIVEQHRRFVTPSARIDFPAVIVDTAEGCTFTDLDGRTYLDFHAMACIMNVGYNHPAVVRAVCDQARQLMHCNPGYAIHSAPTRLAEVLAGLAPGDMPRRVALGLSGSDANDGAIKLARAATGRHRLIAFRRSYHGSTLGALALSAVSLPMRRGFGPELPGVYHVPFPDPYRMSGTPDEVAERCLDELRDVFETIAPPDEVAAVFVEPIQGDAGITVPPQAYMDGLAALCREHGILIVAEEVQTGMGRTGRWFASEHFGLVPDIVLMGKALGSGMPVSALIARSELMDSWTSPGHVFCTGANPVCCAAALATVGVVESERLLSRSRVMGARLRAGLEELASRYEGIGDVRGLGLMLGADLVKDRETKERDPGLAARVIVGCLSRGLYLTFLRRSVLRFAPPLTVTEDEIDRALTIVDEAFGDALAGRVSDAEANAVVGW